MGPMNGKSNCVSWYVDGILACYAELSRFPDLEPSSRVNYAFEKLVRLCSETPDEIVIAKVLSDPSIVALVPRLRQLCSDGEYNLEMSWARRICSCETPEEANETLLAFPYLGNYVDLIRIELSALSSVKPGDCDLCKFAIIGSGPLPLTSLCISDYLHKKAGSITCHNVDQNPLAISLSKTLCSALGRSKRTMGFECADANNAELDLTCFDVVYLAALVGACSEHKHKIMVNIVKRIRPGALVVLRSAHALRSLLYPVVEVTHEMSSIGLKPLLVVHPYNSVINSVVIAIVETPSGRCP